MDLDPQLASLIKITAAGGQKQLWEMTPAEARETLLQMIKLAGGDPPDLHCVEDRRIPDVAGPITLRIYTPRAIASDEMLPVLIYIHGGGWLRGDLETHDILCRSFAKEADCLCIAVDYRRPPEHKYPTPVDDVYTAACWVAENALSFGGDPERIAIGGDSSGGNLAAVVTHLARDRGGPALIFQMLLYPVTDCTSSSPSCRELADGYFLTLRGIMWFTGHYLNDETERKAALASPIFAEDFRNLPPALVVTAGYDPLRDEGAAYAKNLHDAGVPVEYTCYGDMIHGFISMPGITPTATKGIKHCAQALRAAFSA